MSDDLKFYEFKPVSGQAPSKMVIILHGFGADGRDLIGLAPALSASLGDVVFIAPDAPYPCEMAPMGRQWYSLQDWTETTMRAGAENVLPVLDSFISAQLERYGLSYGDLVLSGFSQGAMMALYSGLRQKEKVAGILGFSGWLLEDEDVSDFQKVPVHLIHGEDDQIVPFPAWGSAMERLKKAGFPVSGESRPGVEHWIDDKGIASATEFLKTLKF
jgi:phospholipase/carboxylesterase